MPKISEGQFALGGLTGFAIWLFIVLPLLYYPTDEGQGMTSQTAANLATVVAALRQSWHSVRQLEPFFMREIRSWKQAGAGVFRHSSPF